MKSGSAIQDADIEKVILFEGRLYLTSHFFFDDYDETLVAIMLDCGCYQFFLTEAGKEAAAKRDAKLAKLGAKWR